MIRNYTSSISAEKSVARIEAMLVAAGVKQVLKIYSQSEDHSLEGIVFEYKLANTDRFVSIKLPARVEQIENLLKAKIKRHTDSALANIKEQAQRTAWKLLAEWVEINIALVELQQIDLLEVFLPYVYNNFSKQTYYETLSKNAFKQLMLTNG